MWQDDIREAKYTSPSGQEFSFIYEALSIEIDKKTTEFQFAEKDGVYIQDLGRAGRSFPFIVFFVGDDYNKDADKFLDALEEKGIAKLEHPLYGDRNVIPTGKITRRDDLITEANQAVFNVTFSETIKDIFFPTTETDATTDISNNLDELQQTQSKKFSLDIISENVGDKINLATRMSSQITKFSKGMNDIIRFTNEIKTQFDTIKSSYDNSIDTVFDNAETICYQGLSLIRLPSRTSASFQLKSQTYSDMFSEIVTDFSDAIGINNFFETNKNLMGYVSALCEAVLYSDFATQNDAIEASENILDMLDNLQDFQNEYIESLGIVDTGEDYETLLKLISKITGYLISISFNLPKQKSIILGEETNFIPLCSEIYGSVDMDVLDYFIESNNLNCNEIEILPIGREIVYYE